MQVKELIVIELTGDARENRKSKEAIHSALRCTGGVMLVNAIKSVYAVSTEANEVYYSSEDKADFRKYIKEKIATAIGRQALEDKFIKFLEMQDRFETKVKGELLVFIPPEAEDDE